MGLLRRLADRFDPSEQRGVDPSWRALAGAANWSLHGRSTNSVNISPEVAECVSAVHACINAISSAIASLPVYVYRIDQNGRTNTPSHPLALLIRNGVNANQSFPAFLEFVVADCLRHGNALAEVITDKSGQVKSLVAIPWRNVTPVLLPSGRLAFDITAINAQFGGNGKVRRLLDSEVMHLAERSDDGLIGRSRLSRCSSPVRAALNQNAFGEALYENQAAPSGVLSFAERLTEEQRSVVSNAVTEKWASVCKAGKVFVTDGDAKFQPINQTPEHLEMNEAQRFSAEEIFRMFAVPPPIVGDYRNNTFTNAAQAGLWFAQHCLTPWIRKIEESFRRSIFSEGARQDHEIEFDLGGFLRGDPETRWAAHEIAIRNGILTPNEVREIEGWNPREDLAFDRNELG